MANAKVQLRVGSLDFECEGEETWVAEQLDKVLSRLSTQPIEIIQNALTEPPKITVSNQGIVTQPCDMVVLKYAQAFYGADRAVSQRLTQSGGDVDEMKPRPGEYRLLLTNGAIAARQALFVGVPEFGRFDYAHIRDFAESALNIAAQEAPGTTHLAMTMHGVGFGLDEREAFTAQLSGLSAAIRKREYPPHLAQITIVTRDQEQASRLRQMLNEFLLRTQEIQYNS